MEGSDGPDSPSGDTANSTPKQAGPSLKPSGSNSSNKIGRSEAEKAMEVQKIGPLYEHGGCELKLVNVTATANVGCTLNLQDVVMKARNAEYNPKRFSACVSRRPKH